LTSEDVVINVAAGYNTRGRWEEGIRAAEGALRPEPSNQLAENNLAWAHMQKSQMQEAQTHRAKSAQAQR
jgi:hypothetical protein